MENLQLRTLVGTKNSYTEIGLRGDEYIAISMLFAVNPENSVATILNRFIAYKDDGSVSTKSFKHFIPREFSDAKITGGHTVSILRLNRSAIPVLTGAGTKEEFLSAGDKLQVWPMLASWIKENLQAEGFEPFVDDLAAFVRGQFAGPPQPLELKLTLPDLAVEKAQQIKMQSHNSHDYDA
jgi:hypothetical protein